MPEVQDFQPEWFSPPGHAVAETLQRTGTPVHDFAWEMDLSHEQLQRLFDGRLPLTDAIAARLEKTLGVSATFWALREAQYRRDMQRIAEAIPRETATELLKKVPLKDMERFGWIEAVGGTAPRLAECFRYFDVASVESFERRLDHLLGSTKLRKSPTLKSKPAALAAWIRKGEIEAETISCAQWDPSALEAGLPDIRKLTLIRDPRKFLPTLRTHCAKAGVALVVARGLPGCRASGVTKFVSADKALLMLSCRHMSDDHFWFSFFHECGHLLRHGRDAVFIEGEPHNEVQHELEANEFAQDVLIPEPWRRLIDKLPLNKTEIVRFAVRAGVSPGIVVGQLQHRKRLSHGYLNYLKRRYEWTTSPEMP